MFDKQTPCAQAYYCGFYIIIHSILSNDMLQKWLKMNRA